VEEDERPWAWRDNYQVQKRISKEPVAPKTPVEDIQMKKALELLRENKQPLQRAA
jgi:hypothetical protein